MDISAYCKLASRTLAKTDDDNLHVILGMITEIGELADIYKKNMASGKPIDLVNVKEEVGDLMWYIANFCNVHNFDLEEILRTNIAKLMIRYPQKFTSDAHDVRDLDKERQVLEGKSTMSALSDEELLDLTSRL